MIVLSGRLFLCSGLTLGIVLWCSSVIEMYMQAILCGEHAVGGSRYKKDEILVEDTLVEDLVAEFSSQSRISSKLAS